MNPKFGLFLLVMLPACSLASPGTAPASATGGGGPDPAQGDGGSSVEAPCEAPVPEGPPWWDRAFRRRIEIVLRGVPGEALADVPVLIKLTPERIRYDHTAGGGRDLRFVNSNGALLRHEVESWSRDGDSYLWVNVPRIDPSGEERIWLYYDNPDANSIGDAADVWRASYVGVYHFSPGAGDGDRVRDSAGLYPGTFAGTGFAETEPGLAGSAVVLADGRYIDLGLNAPELAAEPGDARTIEAWFKTTTKGPTASRFVTSQEDNCKGWGIAVLPSGQAQGRFFAGIGCGIHEQDFVAADTDVADGDWHHVALVVDRPGLSLQLYVNGKLQSTETIDNIGNAQGIIHRIGAEWDAQLTEAFVGSIDEFRVAKTAFSETRIAVEHAAMKDALAEYGPTTCP